MIGYNKLALSITKISLHPQFFLDWLKMKCKENGTKLRNIQNTVVEIFFFSADSS